MPLWAPGHMLAEGHGPLEVPTTLPLSLAVARSLGLLLCEHLCARREELEAAQRRSHGPGGVL